MEETKQRHPKEPPMRGTDTFTAVGESFTIGNIKYGWRQLGLRDGTEWIKICEKAITWGLHDAVVKLSEALAQGLVGNSIAYLLVPLMGCQAVEDRIFAWLETMVLQNGKPLKEGALSQCEDFPLHSLVEIIEKLDTHPGLQSFFGSLPRLGHLTGVKIVVDWVQSSIKRYEAMTAGAKPSETPAL